MLAAALLRPRTVEEQFGAGNADISPDGMPHRTAFRTSGIQAALLVNHHCFRRS